MFWTAFASGGRRVYYDYPARLKPPASLKPKVEVEEQFKLTEEDVSFFYENGYLGPFDLIPAEVAETFCKDIVDSVAETESEVFSFEQGDYEFDENNPAHSTALAKKRMNLFNRHLDDSRLLNLFRSRAVTERCAQLLGPNLILWRTFFFNILPRSPGTAWHQASTYLLEDMQESIVNPPDMEELFQLTCWVALTDATLEKGCMRVIPGSQKDLYTISLTPAEEGSANNVYGAFDGTLDYPIDSSEKRNIEMKAGQFFLFTERVLHGSRGNSTDGTRWAVNARITRTDTRIYTERMLNNSHRYSIYGISKLSLDNWDAVLVRGEDEFGINRLRPEPTTEAEEAQAS